MALEVAYLNCMKITSLRDLSMSINMMALLVIHVFPLVEGDPQSCILWPLLKTIFTKYICNVSELLFTVPYADDTDVLIN